MQTPASRQRSSCNTERINRRRLRNPLSVGSRVAYVSMPASVPCFAVALIAKAWLVATSSASRERNPTNRRAARSRSAVSLRPGRCAPGGVETQSKNTWL